MVICGFASDEEPIFPDLIARPPSTSPPSCGNAGNDPGTADPFAEFLDRDHRDGEGDDENPDRQRQRGGAEQGIAARRVNLV